MYAIAKQSYGRERYLTVVRQGVVERRAWTEDLALAERFQSVEEALRIDWNQGSSLRAYPVKVGA